MKPFRVDPDGTEVYTTDQVDVYGLPNSLRFYVIETPEYAHPVQQEWFNIPEPKPVHRYCRLLRFKTTLYQLLGSTGFKTGRSNDLVDTVLQELPCSISYTPPCMLWEEIRKVLKKLKLHIFYNRIPVIANTLKLITHPRVSHKVMGEIIESFKKMSDAFDEIKHTLNRTYFPSMRFMALRLCQEYNVKLNIAIPFCRTIPRYTALHELYDKLMCKVAENELDALLK